MLTRNAYAMLAAKLFTSSAVIKVTKTNGQNMALYPSTSLARFAEIMKTLSTSITSAGAVLGTGSTPATLNDTTISGEVISNYTYTAAVSVSEVNNGTECTAVYTVTNTGTEDFTVSEIALLDKFYTASSSSNGCFMVDRTVLDKPITIPAGGIGVITYTIRMNYPTA